MRAVLEGLRGGESIAELCRKEGIRSNLYYRWSKEFLEAGKKRLARDTKWEGTSSEVTELRQENEPLKQTVAEMLLKARFLKNLERCGFREQRYMRHPAEKLETIRFVEDSELSVTATLRELRIPRRTFYGWYRRYQDRGAAGLADRYFGADMSWKLWGIPEHERRDPDREGVGRRNNGGHRNGPFRQ